MNSLKTVCGLLVLWVAGAVWAADTLTPEQKEVKQFIEKMYSYDPDTFEFGEFSKKDGSPFLRNRVPNGGGKYQPPKKCALLNEFFESGIIEKKEIRSGLVGCEAPSRYLPAMDLSSYERLDDIQAPDIRTPVVKDNKAMVFVFFGNKTKPHEYASDMRGMIAGLPHSA